MTPTFPQLIAKGESATLELKGSTGELREVIIAEIRNRGRQRRENKRTPLSFWTRS